MKIGLRTVKTAVCATLAILIASSLGLFYPTSAGIIAILSVTNTKRSSFQVGFYRICSLVLATCIAWICFKTFGYTPFAFGTFLVLFIPIAAAWNMSEGIAVSSVLVTQFLVEQTMDFWIIKNAFFLMFIGLGLSLLANLYMPNIEKKLKSDQVKIEEKLRILLYEMAKLFDQKSPELNTCDKLVIEVEEALKQGEIWAIQHAENQLLTQNSYYIHYLDMRHVQVQLLKSMNVLLHDIHFDMVAGKDIRQLFESTAETLSEMNDGQKIAKKVQDVYQIYREMPLPQSRKEFENRAKLYQLLTQFETFIEIKIEFVEQQELWKQGKKEV